MTGPEAPSTHCNHFVARKKRFCRMTVKTGDKYCGEHQPPSDSKEGQSDAKLRVVCPLDRKHTCYAHNLQKHLKICNARAGAPLPYIQKGVNLDDGPDEEARKLCDFTPEEIKGVVEKVNKVYAERLGDKVTYNFSTHTVVEAEMEKPEHGDKSKKHLKQASAILGILKGYDLLTTDTCFVEFGAGRGQLSYWLAQATSSSNACFLLVERSSPKHKRDNKLDKPEDEVKRIRADIADLVLEKVEYVAKSQSVVGVTKHLCGDATDLALRCLSNVSDQAKVKGLLMTFCCHHRCRWKAYTGKDFFKEADFCKNDFDMMCGMSSWATCGSGLSRERQNENRDEVQNERDKEIGLNRVQKEELGRKCKTVLNWGRLRFLEGLGFKCFLHYYVEDEVSLENVCIVAMREKVKEK